MIDISTLELGYICFTAGALCFIMMITLGRRRRLKD